MFLVSVILWFDFRKLITIPKYFIGPEGCLQYHTTASGKIRRYDLKHKLLIISQNVISRFETDHIKYIFHNLLISFSFNFPNQANAATVAAGGE